MFTLTLPRKKKGTMVRISPHFPVKKINLNRKNHLSSPTLKVKLYYTPFKSPISANEQVKKIRLTKKAVQ
jgi:hypothetical protein